MYAPKSTAGAKGSLAGTTALEASNGSSSGISFNDNPLRDTVIGLAAAAGALLLAVIALFIMMARRDRSGVRAAPFADQSRDSFVSDARGYPYVTPYDDHARKSTDKLNH